MQDSPTTAPIAHERATRGWLAALALLLVTSSAAVGCGASRRDDDTTAHRHGRPLPTLRASEDESDGDDGDDGVVKWEAKLKEDAPEIVAEFRRRASRYGCDTQGDDDDVLADCKEAPIRLSKRGRRVTVACKGVSLEACRNLFGRIVDAGKPAGGGQQPPNMW